MNTKHYYKELLSSEFIDELIKNEDFIDGRKGGLILGNSHKNGGVLFLYQFPEGFRVFGEVEGYEYVLSKESTDKHRRKLNDIGNYDRDVTQEFEPFEIPEHIKIIDARKNSYESKYVLLDTRGGFAIINKYSTKIYLSEIDFLNKN